MALHGTRNQFMPQIDRPSLATSTVTLVFAVDRLLSDKAFVGSDDGIIYRISCVFHCPLNTQPSVDWSFTLPVAGTGGSSATPNGPVYDFPDGRLFVGDQLGELWVYQCERTSPRSLPDR